jgi:hypothetical protein
MSKRWRWIRGGRCLSCGRRWRLRRLQRSANAETAAAPDPAPVARTGPTDLDPNEVTRFDLIRHHPYLDRRR